MVRSADQNAFEHGGVLLVAIAVTALAFLNIAPCALAEVGSSAESGSHVDIQQRAKAPGAAGQAPGELLSLRFVPEEITIWGAEGSNRFLVLGKFADGLERDVTSECRISLTGRPVAAFAGTGRLISQADGDAVLKAEYAGRLAKAGVRVQGSSENRPFGFERDIVGIFTRQGCNDSHCHGGVKGRGGFKLSFNGLHPHEDYQWIVEGGGYQVLSAEPLGPKIPRVDLKNPEKSLLLLKPTLSV
jgi:hypothetical protein